MVVVEMETKDKFIPKKSLLVSIIEKLIEERVYSKRISQCGREIENELLSLSDIIRKKLGRDQGVFMRYEELSTISENESLIGAYKQGLEDGIQLMRDILIEGKTSSKFL